MIDYIDEIHSLSAAISDLMSSKIIAVDCEGVDLSRKGDLSTIQKKNEKQIYIFDYVLLGPALIPEMKKILENENILKLAFDFRNDYDCLLHLNKIKCRNVLDVQILEFLSKTSLKLTLKY